MNGDEDLEQFFQDARLDTSKLFVELPATPSFPYPEKIPFGYDPIGEIYLRGRASRNLASGKIPWWVLVTGWSLFGGGLSLILAITVHTLSFEILLTVLLPLIFLMILWRGTYAKVAIRNHRGSGR